MRDVKEILKECHPITQEELEILGTQIVLQGKEGAAYHEEALKILDAVGKRSIVDHVRGELVYATTSSGYSICYRKPRIETELLVVDFDKQGIAPARSTRPSSPSAK